MTVGVVERLTMPTGLCGQRPGDMLAQQRRGVVLTRCQSRDDRRRARGVAERDGDIAQPALVSDPANRAARQARVELIFAPGEEGGQWRRIETVANGKIGIANPGEAVPRAT